MNCLELFCGTKSVGGGSNREERYRVPEKLIYSLFLD